MMGDFKKDVVKLNTSWADSHEMQQCLCGLLYEITNVHNI